MVSSDASTIFEFNCWIEPLEIKDGGKDEMIFGRGRGDFIFGGSRSGRIVVGEWR